MKKIVVLFLLTALMIPVFGNGQTEESPYEWQPAKPVNLVVPWGAGGSTDRSARTTAGILEEFLGQKIVVVNQPGASGSVGTKEVLDSEPDGLKWVAGAVKDLGVYKIQGMIDTTLDDWNLYLNVAMPNVVAVRADSPYQDFGELIAAMKANPGQIKVASAGVNSAGHTAIELIKKYTGITYKHLTYDGGNPAVIATVGGEADMVAQLSVEEVDMLRAGKLRALAVMSDKSLSVEGYDQEIPPITNWIKDFKSAPIYFGIFVPAGVPAEVTNTLDKIWEEKVKTSQELKDWAFKNAVVFDPCYGKEAMDKSFPMVQISAWLKYDAGDVAIEPSTIGIPRP
ncbi:MAG: tripartite tricarboxylate transporter substrate binding protein [Spirochaetaceae bacterium]|jgi:tripartite-type tricarboxylate transporter receptor subunit TctC|nr:tripartite tricarboxylate transporter substrate binding protein [Spirochaetaceae bacterium]